MAIESKVRFGFGVDENTALDVAPDGTIEVIGAGQVTIVDGADATCEDGPLGCRMANIRLLCLAAGDRFDPRTGQAQVFQGKKQIVEGAEEYNGNYPIPDISGTDAVLQALINGLANNTSRKQVAFTLKYNRHYGHGYRFTFLKTDETRSYTGDVNGDGYDDVIVAAPAFNTHRDAEAFVVFGHGGSFAAATSLLLLNGDNGFRGPRR